MSIPEGDLSRALARNTRNARTDTWVVVAGTSTTEFTVALATNNSIVPNIDSTSAANLVGLAAEFYTLSGSTASVTRTIAGVSYDSASSVLTVTLKSALPETPQAGDEFVVYGTQTTTIASQSINQLGGTDLPKGGDAWSGDLLPVGGVDQGGTARMLKTDSEGRIITTSAASSYQGVVGTGSTTTVVVDSIGGFATDQWDNWGIQFSQNTATAALQGVWQKITSNTSTDLTLSAALPAAPASGDTYDIRPFGSQVQDLTAVAGQAVPGSPFGTRGAASPGYALLAGGDDGTNLHGLKTDTSGRIEESNLYATSNDNGSAIKGGGLQVGGSDGTDFRLLALDASGLLRLSSDLYALASVANPGAATDFASFTAAQSGTATVEILLATATVLNLHATPSGGVGGQVGSLESGASLPAGEWQTIQFPVSKGATYALQVATAQGSAMLVHILVSWS